MRIIKIVPPEPNDIFFMSESWCFHRIISLQDQHIVKHLWRLWIWYYNANFCTFITSNLKAFFLYTWRSKTSANDSFAFNSPLPPTLDSHMTLYLMYIGFSSVLKSPKKKSGERAKTVLTSFLASAEKLVKKGQLKITSKTKSKIFVNPIYYEAPPPWWNGRSFQNAYKYIDLKVCDFS